MRVLYASFKYSYGRPEDGLSHEYLNLYDAMTHMEGVAADFFPVDERMQAVGRDAMNEELRSIILEKKYDILFCQLFTEEIKKETIAYITTRTKTKTINWFADDHFRFYTFSRYWAPYFTLVTTTDKKSLLLYKRIGVSAHLTQWACNPHRYKPDRVTAVSVNDKVTFVGQAYGQRPAYAHALTSAHLPQAFFGLGWPEGVIGFEQMLAVFTESAINLNFTESSAGTMDWLHFFAQFVLRKELGKLRLNIHRAPSVIRSLAGSRRMQIKGRTFEIPGCGGFMITGNAEGLSDYYEPDREIVIFSDTDDLIAKCRYYLDHPDERRAIAEAGCARTLRDHTYEGRFKDIFSKLA